MTMPLFKNKQIYELKMSGKQREAVQIVNDMLLETIMYFGETSKITSETTAEIIDINELYRVRGILSGLTDSTDWVAERK